MLCAVHLRFEFSGNGSGRFRFCATTLCDVHLLSVALGAMQHPDEPWRFHLWYVHQLELPRLEQPVRALNRSFRTRRARGKQALWHSYHRRYNLPLVAPVPVHDSNSQMLAQLLCRSCRNTWGVIATKLKSNTDARVKFKAKSCCIKHAERDEIIHLAVLAVSCDT